MTASAFASEDLHLGKFFIRAKILYLSILKGKPARAWRTAHQTFAIARRRGDDSIFDYASCVPCRAGSNKAGFIRSVWQTGNRGRSSGTAGSARLISGLTWKEPPTPIFIRVHRGSGALLEAHLLAKAIYELGYELQDHPDRVHVPLRAILRSMK